jgi:hypothetical protein
LRLKRRLRLPQIVSFDNRFHAPSGESRRALDIGVRRNGFGSIAKVPRCAFRGLHKWILATGASRCLLYLSIAKRHYLGGNPSLRSKKGIVSLAQQWKKRGDSVIRWK